MQIKLLDLHNWSSNDKMRNIEGELFKSEQRRQLMAEQKTKNVSECFSEWSTSGASHVYAECRHCAFKRVDNK